MRRKRQFIRFGVAVVGVLFMSAPAQALFHYWQFKELFSNADGTVQFIELFTAFNSQQFAMGKTFRASQGANTNDFVFPSNTPAPTANHHLLLATAAFASLPGAVTPDFIIPDGFLFTPDGKVENLVLGGDSLTYPVLPTDGVLSLNADLTTGPNSPTNYAGDSGCVEVVCVDNDGDTFCQGAGCAGPDCDDNDPEIHPGAAEVCDNVDNNCIDGIDENTELSCYTGPGGTEGVGICTAGQQFCVGGAYGACVGEVLPGVEVCDGQDNDCNGVTDEGFPDSDGDGIADCVDNCPIGCQLYGDVFPFILNGNVGNCVADIDDLLVILGAFAISPVATKSCGGPWPDDVNMFPCGTAFPDCVVDIDDVVAELGAFAANYACAHPCPP